MIHNLSVISLKKNLFMLCIIHIISMAKCKKEIETVESQI